MTTFLALRRVIFLCAGLALLPGCGVAGGSAPAGAQTPVAATAKPGSALAVQAQGSTAFAASGASARLDLRFTQARPGASLIVTYRAEPGVALESATQVTLTADAQGRASDTPLLRGTQDGRHYLNVFVTQDDASGRTQQVVSIPVTFGAASVPIKRATTPGAAAVVTPAGESLVILPASPRK